MSTTPKTLSLNTLNAVKDVPTYEALKVIMQHVSRLSGGIGSAVGTTNVSITGTAAYQDVSQMLVRITSTGRPIGVFVSFPAHATGVGATFTLAVDGVDGPGFAFVAAGWQQNLPCGFVRMLNLPVGEHEVKLRVIGPGAAIVMNMASAANGNLLAIGL